MTPQTEQREPFTAAITVNGIQTRFEQQMADYQGRVAERVVRAREAKGYDREPFALLAGISPKQLTRIEEGKSAPRLATVRKIAAAAGVDITYIRPDLEAEEDELRAQLDRIERKLDELLRRLKDDESGEDADHDRGLPPQEPPPIAPAEGEPPSEGEAQPKRGE